MSAISQKFSVVMTDLSGGQVDGEHPTQIAENQFESCVNCYGIGKKLVGRPGIEKVSSAGAYTANLNAFRTFRPTASNWGGGISNIMVGTQNGFAYLNGTALTAISSALPASANPWHMRQYKDIMYAAREQTLRADTLLRRVTLTGAATAGIAAPSAAATAVQGAAGVLVAGAYTYVVTFRNSATGAESNPSPSVAVTIAASRQVDLSAIPTSANAQVDSRRIYRSLIDQSGIYYLVATIANNTATTYSDNIAQSALGDAASSLNAEPPVGMTALEEWNERLWMAGESNVYYSRALFPESWPATNLIQVAPDDNQVIRGLLADGKGKRLLIGKSGSIHEITGVSNANFRLDLLSQKHGVAGSHAMATAEGMVFFYSGENVYGMAPGSRDPQSVSTVAIRKILDAVPAAYRKDVRLSVYTPLSWLIVLVSRAGDNKHTKMLVYNYKTGAWVVFTSDAFNTTAVPSFVGEAQDSDFVVGLYAVIDAGASIDFRFLYKFTDDVYSDDGTAIAFLAQTRGIAADGRLVCIDDVGVMGRTNYSATDSPTVTVGAIVDGTAYGPGATVTLASSTIQDQAARWERGNISTKQKPGTFVQLSISKSQSTSRIELAGLSLNCLAMNRRRKVA